MSDDSSKLGNHKTVLGWMQPGPQPAQPQQQGWGQQPAPQAQPQQWPQQPQHQQPQHQQPQHQQPQHQQPQHQQPQQPPWQQHAQQPQQAWGQQPQPWQQAQQPPQAQQPHQAQWPQHQPHQAQHQQPHQAQQHQQPHQAQQQPWQQHGQQPPQQPWQQAQQPPQPQAWQQHGQPQWGHQGQPQGFHGGYGAPDMSGRGIHGADATVGVSNRVRFIRLTYLHLLGAILVFAGLEYLLFTNEALGRAITLPMVKFALGGRFNWAIVLGVFMVVSWIADYWASHTSSRPLQYAGLAFYVIAETLIFVPLLAIVQVKTASIIAKGGTDPNILRDAAITTLAIFGALTASVLFTKKDFSFLRTGLALGGAAATMLIVLSLAFGFNLGIVFSIGMVVLAAGYILYQTSQVLAHYNTESYVAAALALFSSVALMFWYIIRIFMRARE